MITKTVMYKSILLHVKIDTQLHLIASELGNKKTGTWFKVSSARQEKWVIKLATPLV